MTSRGLKEEDFILIGKLIAKIVKEGDEAIKDVKKQVLGICAKYPLYAEDITR
jgi:glycine/serine hydroxymethyltransferase